MTQKKILILLSIILLFLVACEPNYTYYSPIDWLSNPIKYDDSDAPTKMGVAAVCMKPNRETSETLKSMQTIVEDTVTKHSDLRLIVFGESITGLYWVEDDPSEYHKSIAEPIPGPSTNAMASVAIAQNVYIAFGMTESKGDKLYNSAVLIDPTGEIIIHHHKNHLFESDNTIGFTAGEEAKWAYIDDVKVSMVICNDSDSLKLTKEIAELEPQIVCVLLADTDSMSAFEGGYDQNYSRQYNAWLVIGNRIGNEGGVWDFKGYTMIQDPTGAYREYSEGKSDVVYHNIGVY